MNQHEVDAVTSIATAGRTACLGTPAIIAFAADLIPHQPAVARALLAHFADLMQESSDSGANFDPPTAFSRAFSRAFFEEEHTATYGPLGIDSRMACEFASVLSDGLLMLHAGQTPTHVHEVAAAGRH